MSRGRGHVTLPQVDGPDTGPAADQMSFLPDKQSDPSASNIGNAVSIDDIQLPDARTQVEQLHGQMAATDADHNAQVLGLSAQTGEHPAFVDKNLPAIQQAAKAPPASFFQQLEDQYPGTTQFLQKPEHMAVAHDDLTNVAKHEDILQQHGQANGFIEEGKAAWENSLGGMITGGKPGLTPNPDAPWYDKFASIPAGLAGDLPFMIGGGLAGAAAGTAVAGPVGTVLGAATGGFGAPAAVKRAFQDHYAKGDISSSDDLIDRTKDILAEFGKQSAVGLAVEATGGLVGLAGGVAGKSATAAGYSARVLGGISTATKAAGLLTEAGTMEVAGKGVEGEKPSLGGFIENLATIGGMHAFGALPPVEMAKAAAGKAALSLMGDVAADSKLRQRMPEAYEKMVDQLTDKGSVFIPVQAADTYFQSKRMNPETVMEGIGAGDSYREAKQTGNDIEIPLSQWLSKVAPTEHFQGLLDHTRLLDSETPTVDEVRQKTEDAKGRFQQILDAQKDAHATADQAAGGDYVPDSPLVFNDRYEQLRATGMSDFEAKHNAIVHDQFFSRMGEQFGVSGDQLANDFKFQVGNADTPQSVEGMVAQSQDGQTLEQSPVDRLARAKSLGFNTDRQLYHGTYADIDQFKVGKKVMNGRALGDGVYLTPDPKTASEYASPSRSSVGRMGGNVMPVFAKLEKPFHLEERVDEAFRDKLLADKKLKSQRSHIEAAKDNFDLYSILRNKKGYDFTKGLKDAGFDGVEAPHMKTTVVFDPEQIRSVNAEFDPSKADSANILHQSGGEWKLPEASPNGEKFDDHVKITEADHAPILDRDGKFSAEATKQHADTEFAGKTFTNLQSGLEVEFNPKGLKKAQGRIGDRVDAIAHANLDKLLENAQYVGKEPDRYGRADVKGMDAFYAPMRAEGKDYLVKILARETDGKRIYDQVSVERESGFGGNKEGRTGDLPDRTSEEALGDGASGRPSSLSIADFEKEISQAKQQHSWFQGESTPRAQIAINGKDFRIDMFKDADRSSFLHETGHMFLEVMKNLAARDDAPAAIKNDFQAIRDWMGLKDGEEIQNEHHEQWARGFEAYLMDGKAPSSAMEKTFGIFRRWLTNIYKTMTNLHVDLSPEIRGVMDRMLATDEEIRRASALSGYEIKDLPDVPEEIRGKIRDLQTKARDLAESQLLREQMKEVTAEHRQALEVERQRLDAQARPEVEKLPIFQAAEDLRASGDPEAKTPDPYAMAERGLRGEFTPEEASHFEVAAEQHGFASGEDLAHQLVDARDTNLFEREVKDRVNEGLKSHADLKDTALIREKALEAIHTNRSTELLALEREALSKLVTNAAEKSAANIARRADAKIEAAAAKEAAKEFLAKKSVKDAGNIRTYITAERRAAERGASALAKKDYEGAVQAKREQLLNHALAAEAMKNKAEVEKTVSKLTKIARRDNLKDMPYGFTRQIDQVLSRFGLKERVPEDAATLGAIAQDMLKRGENGNSIADSTGLVQDQTGRFVPETISQFVSRVNDNYFAMSLPDTVMNGTEKGFKELTLAQLREVRAGSEMLQKVGQFMDRYLESDRKISIKEAAAEFRARAEETFGTPRASDLLPGSSSGSGGEDLLKGIKAVPAYFDRWLDTISTTCRKLDGLKDGPAQENISRPLQAASDRKIIRTHEAIKEIDQILAKHYTPEEFAKYSETRIKTGTRADGTPEYFTKEEILSMALNTGNDGNRQRLLTGFKWDETKLQSVLSNLGKKDFDFAQETWDHIGKYWPEIKKLEMDINGYEPKGVEAKEFTNEHGTFPGGYYPISYDFEKSAEALKSQQEKDALYKQFSTARAATDQGHTEARVSNVDRPLRLSLDVLREHHENVIHDLEFRRPVIDVSRFLFQNDVKTAIVNAMGPEGYTGIQDWLKSAASSSSEPSSFGQQTFRWFRFKTTMYSMGYRLATAPKILAENAINLASENGVSGATRAIVNYWKNRSGIHETVMEKSPFMMERATHLDRDQADILEKFKGTKQSLLKQYAFGIHAKLDQAFSVPLWNDVYSRGVGVHGDEKLAVTQADEAVRRGFMSGAETNQAKIMRGGEGQKLFTVAFGYSNMMWNRFSEQKFQAGMQLRDGEYGAAMATMVHASAYTFLMPAIVTALTRELLHNSQSKNQDDQKKRVASSLIEEATPLKFVPVLRDAFPYLVKKATGEHSSFQATPMESALTTLLDPAGELVYSAFTGKRLPDKFPEQALNAISYTAGVPKQVDDLAMNFMDWQKNHGAAAWLDFVSRRTKK